MTPSARWNGAGRSRSFTLTLLLLLVVLPGVPGDALAQSGGTAAQARRLVVIDAGHGGVDKGATGPGGTHEKDIALAVARQLAALLREQEGYEVRLTRERDVLVPLRERTRLANAWRGEEGGREAIFISIHCNAADARSARGIETFFLSEARTEDARRVAQRENAAQRFETANQQLDPLTFILRDLQQNQYLRESSEGAAIIQSRLAATYTGPDRGVKQAGFVVLDGAFMPAVLVEIGFLTNPAEERMLRDPEHQRRVAQSLARGVRDYFARPAASRLANDS